MDLPRTFRTKEPEQLRADLERLSDVARSRLQLEELPAATGAVRAQPGKRLPLSGAAAIQMPDVAELLGVTLSLQRLDTAGAIELSPAIGQTVNGVDPYTLPLEVRCFRFVATKQGWWLE